jgi:FtsH-binding integral membrane protein
MSEVKNSWNPFSYPPQAVLKTIYGFVLPGVVALGAAFARAQGDPTKPVTTFDVVAALVAMFVTGGAVFSATNRPQEPHREQPPDAGAVGVLFIVGALLVAVAILGLLGVVSLSVTVCIILAIVGILCIVLDVRRGRL